MELFLIKLRPTKFKLGFEHGMVKHIDLEPMNCRCTFWYLFDNVPLINFVVMWLAIVSTQGILAHATTKTLHHDYTHFIM